jgi:ectoine hydroxylase-related dioxygenase (phytanoyl-CoA dioxygenase family)
MEKILTDGKDLLGLSVKVTDEMKAAAVALEMRAGSLSIHDSFVLHGSDANTSGRRRAAYTMRYANPKTVTVDTAKHWVPVYLVSGEGGANSAQFVDIRAGQPLSKSGAGAES